MDSGQLSLLETGLWIIPLVLLATIAGLYLLVRTWQNKTQEDLRLIQSELRGIHTAFRQLDQAAQKYSVEDREPFGSEMKSLVAKMDETSRRTVLLQQRYGDLREMVHRRTLNRVQMLIGAPFYWLEWSHIRKELRTLRQEIRAINAEFNASQMALEALSQRGWQIAGQARQVVEQEGSARRLLEQFKERRVHGEAFETALRQDAALRAALGKIPKYFLSGDEDSVLGQADKEGVADVYAILEDTRAPVARLLEQVQGWETEYQETAGRVANLRKTLGEIEILLESRPPELVVDALQTRLRQMTTISDNLNATLSRLEIESMGSVAQEADRTRTAAQEMGEQLRRSRRQLVALERILDELNGGLKGLADQFSTLSRRDDYPIAWNNSRAQYMNVSRQASAIGAFKQPRSPEQVDKDLAAAGTLLAQQKELARHYQQIAQQHAEFLGILISSELRQGPEWLRSAQILAAQAAAYSPENWPRAESVVSLPSELKDLAERHQRFAALNPADPILEADMIQELEKARGLASQHKSLRERVAKIQTRLVELQEVDRTARERMQFARNALGQIELLARSNAFLSEIASPEIAALKAKLEQQAAEIEQRQRGLVEEKSKALQALVQQIEAAASTWLERLNAEIEARKKTIADRLDVLGQIANLEERAVVEAQRLLSQDLPTSVAQRSKQRPVLSLEEALSQLKPRSDYWQSCIASIREIEDLERPVLETYNYAIHQYEATKEQLANAAQWVPSRRSWPPTSLSLEDEMQEFNEIDAQWQAIESQPSRAITVVRQLSDLAGKLQALAEKTGRKVERAEQEQTRIRDLEGDLDDLIRRWQALGHEVPQASGEIRKIGSETDRELDRLKRLYRQGALSYSQVLQSMNSLCQDVQNSQITMEDGQVLRLNGNQRTSNRRY